MKIVAELDYNIDSWHGRDDESFKWFIDQIFGNDVMLLIGGDVSDVVGDLKILEIEIND